MYPSKSKPYHLTSYNCTMISKILIKNSDLFWKDIIPQHKIRVEHYSKPLLM